MQYIWLVNCICARWKVVHTPVFDPVAFALLVLSGDRFSDASRSKTLRELFPEKAEDASLQQAIFQVYCKDGPHHRELVPWFRLDPKDPMNQLGDIEKDRTNERSNAQVQKHMV